MVSSLDSPEVAIALSRTSPLKVSRPPGADRLPDVSAAMPSASVAQAKSACPGQEVNRPRERRRLDLDRRAGRGMTTTTGVPLRRGQ